MLNYEEVKTRYAIIKKGICKKFRRELTVVSGIYGEKSELIKFVDYVKFVNELSDDEFAANYISGIMVDTIQEDYELLINDKMSFDEFAQKYLIEIYDEFKNKMNEIDPV